MNYRQTDSGIYIPYFYAPKPKRPTHFDFFAGAGGFGCGMVSAGFETVGANEYDVFAAITYMVNLGHYPMSIHFLDGEDGKKQLDETIARCFGLKGYKHEDGLTQENMEKLTAAQDREFELLKEGGSEKLKGWREKYGSATIPAARHVAGSNWISSQEGAEGCKNFWLGDIRKLTGKMILDTLGMKEGDIDVVTGGPPCQGYSRAGQQKIDDPRNGLVYEYARMIVELQPKTFILEEVPDIVNFFDPDGVPVIDKFCMMLEEGGYGKWEMIKKALATQSNAAAVIKSGSKKMEPKSQKAKKETKCVGVQPTLFKEEE